MLIISELQLKSNNIFLYHLCYYMVFSLGEFPGNICTFITHGIAQASNIDNLLTYGFSHQVLFFQITCQYYVQFYTETLFFSHI